MLARTATTIASLPNFTSIVSYGFCLSLNASVFDSPSRNAKDVAMQLLTAQRASEMARMRWRDLVLPEKMAQRVGW